MIKQDGIVVEIFLYVSNWQTDLEHDICIRGLNGTFGMDEMQEFFKQFKDEPPTQQLMEDIAKEYGTENETMYTIHAELDYDSGEYGDYGAVLYSAYYWIGKVLNIEKHENVESYFGEGAEVAS